MSDRRRVAREREATENTRSVNSMVPSPEDDQDDDVCSSPPNILSWHYCHVKCVLEQARRGANGPRTPRRLVRPCALFVFCVMDGVQVSWALSRSEHRQQEGGLAIALVVDHAKTRFGGDDLQIPGVLLVLPSCISRLWNT
jgi:hypothetical protein